MYSILVPDDWVADWCYQICTFIHIYSYLYIYIHDEITSPIRTRPSTSGRAPEVEAKFRIDSYSPHGIVISHIEIPKLHPVSFPWDYSIPCWLRLFFRKMHRVCDVKLLFLLFFFFFLFYLWVAYEMPPGLAPPFPPDPPKSAAVARHMESSSCHRPKLLFDIWKWWENYWKTMEKPWNRMVHHHF